MKKIIALLLCVAFVSMEAAHYQSTMSITQIGDKNEFLMELEIEKLSEGSSEVVASPQLICIPGMSSYLTIGSENEADYLFVKALVAKDGSRGVQTSVFMKVEDQVVLSSHHTVTLNNSKKR